jgi:hypothetical protein
MKLPHRRHVLHLAAGAAALSTTSRIVWAQTYPGRQITIVVPVPPGGLVDLVARAVGERLAEIWGQTVMVENKAVAIFRSQHHTSPRGHRMATRCCWRWTRLL